MKRFFIWVLATVCTLVLWAAANFVVTSEGWALNPIADRGDKDAFIKAINQEAESAYQGNLAFAVLERGKPVHMAFRSKGRYISTNSVFGVASLSKWVTAVAVMQLVEQGKLHLDTPVSNYLTRWQLPPSQFDNNKVTLRLLLSHTAGITDGLGHSGFAPGEPVQPLESHLTQAQDADEGKSGKVVVGIEPGTRWMYSGGSYNLIQLIIEEVTGKAFTVHMSESLFQPLGMTNSSFALDRNAPLLAEYFGENRTLRTYPNYTSLAATGLYSSLNDLILFANAQIPTQFAAPNSPRLLSDQSLHTMRQALAQVDGLDIWGAGVMLFAPSNDNEFIVGHGGQSPYLNSSVRIDPVTGDGFIALQTGNKEALASNLATHWTTWQTGKPDIYVLSNTFPAMIKRVLIGSIVIVVLVISLAVILRRRRKFITTR